MSEAGAPIEPANLRASDADRQRVADVLSKATAEGRLGLDEFAERLDAVWAAKTFGELVPITKDLPASAAATQAVPAPAGAGGGSLATVAVFSGAERTGEWLLPAVHSVRAVFGGVRLDLRHVRLSAPVTTIRIVAVMGGVDVKRAASDQP